MEEKMTENNQSNENNEISFIFTINIVDTGAFLGIPWRRWIEGLCFGGVGVLIICAINFTSLVKTIISLIVFFTLFFFGVKGIMNRSITEMLLAEIKFWKNRRELHLSGPEYLRSKKTKITGEGKSNGEEIANRIKARLIEFARQQRQE